MQIQINTDHNIEGREALAARVSEGVLKAIERFSDHITRVEVHLTDETGQERGHKSGQDDKRCLLEARFEGHQPVAVTHHAASVDQAVAGASEKLARKLEHMLGRLRDRKRDTTDASPTEHTPAAE